MVRQGDGQPEAIDVFQIIREMAADGQLDVLLARGRPAASSLSFW